MVTYRNALTLLTIALMSASVLAEDKVSPKPGLKVGDDAQPVEAKDLQDKDLSLKALLGDQPVAVIFLRGYPGYQCPLCTKQVAEFIAKADAFKEANVRVLMIYPGLADKLKEHAAEFVRGKNLPDNFDLVIDPDYAITNAWKLRWDKKGETAYPSTYLVDTANKIVFAKVSTSHGDRSNPQAVIDAAKALKPASKE